MQIIEVNCAIETASYKETHFIVDEDTGDLAVVVIKLLKDEPVSGG